MLTVLPLRWDGSIKLRSGLTLESLDGGIHVLGQESPVLMGQWLFAQGSAGSLRSVGLAGEKGSLKEEEILVLRPDWTLGSESLPRV